MEPVSPHLYSLPSARGVGVARMSPSSSISSVPAVSSPLASPVLRAACRTPPSPILLSRAAAAPPAAIGFEPQAWALLAVARDAQRSRSLVVTLLHAGSQALYAWPMSLDADAPAGAGPGRVFVTPPSPAPEDAPAPHLTSESLRVLGAVLGAWMRVRRRSALAGSSSGSSSPGTGDGDEAELRAVERDVGLRALARLERSAHLARQSLPDMPASPPLSRRGSEAEAGRRGSEGGASRRGSEGGASRRGSETGPSRRSSEDSALAGRRTAPSSPVQRAKALAAAVVGERPRVARSASSESLPPTPPAAAVAAPASKSKAKPTLTAMRIFKSFTGASGSGKQDAAASPPQRASSESSKRAAKAAWASPPLRCSGLPASPSTSPVPTIEVSAPASPLLGPASPLPSPPLRLPLRHPRYDAPASASSGASGYASLPSVAGDAYISHVAARESGHLFSGLSRWESSGSASLEERAAEPIAA